MNTLHKFKDFLNVNADIVIVQGFYEVDYGQIQEIKETGWYVDLIELLHIQFVVHTGVK